MTDLSKMPEGAKPAVIWDDGLTMSMGFVTQLDLWHERARRLKVQRDELLEACKRLANAEIFAGADDDDIAMISVGTLRAIQAAARKATGGGND